MASPVSPVDAKFVLKDARRHAISGFRLGRHFLYTYFEPAMNRWGFEQWDGDKLIDGKLFSRDPRDAEVHFGKAVEKVVGMWNAHMRHNPPLNRYHLPRGVKGVRTFDPAKRNYNRSLLDRYPVADPDDD